MSKIKEFNKDHLIEILSLLNEGNTTTEAYISFINKFDVKIRESTSRNWVGKNFAYWETEESAKWICTNPAHLQVHMSDIGKGGYNDKAATNDKTTPDISSNTQTSTQKQISSKPIEDSVILSDSSQKIINVLKQEDNILSEKIGFTVNSDDLSKLEKNVTGAFYKLEKLENKILSIEKIMSQHIKENDKMDRLIKQLVIIAYNTLIEERNQNR
jgi:hypothetical protein